MCVPDAPRMIAGNTVVLSLCFSHSSDVLLSLPAQLQASRPALTAATDVLLLSDPGSAVGGLASYRSHKLGEMKCSAVFSLLLFISAPVPTIPPGAKPDPPTPDHVVVNL